MLSESVDHDIMSHRTSGCASASTSIMMLSVSVDHRDDITLTHRDSDCTAMLAWLRLQLKPLPEPEEMQLRQP